MKCAVFSLFAIFIALSAADYHQHHHHHGGLHETVLPGPAEVLTYPGKVPLPPCGLVYLLSCSKNSEKVPCVPGKEPYHHAPAPEYHHGPAPAPAPHHPAPAKY